MTKANEMRKLAAQAAVLFTAAILAASELQAQQAQAPRRQIIISLPDRKLALLENGEVTHVFQIAVGKDATPSPTGSFQIVNRVVNPTYYHEHKVIPAGSANPLGTRWLGLSEKGYGIHGTNAPRSIGKAASHGCIRMARTDLEQLFKLVAVGDPVEIRGERDLYTAAIFGTGDSTAPTLVAATESAAGGQ